MRKYRVLVGGSYDGDSWFLRTTGRDGGEPEGRDGVSSFRVVICRVKRRKR